MDLGLTGRRAVVAAGSAGLGLGAAQALAAEGVLVAICGRDQERLDTAVAQIGRNAIGLVADLSHPEEAGRFVAEAAEGLGGSIDIAVANAGGPPPGAPLETTLDSYRQAIELNFVSTVALCNAAAPAMRDSGWGRIVAITSFGAREPIVTLAASSAARAAATSYIKNLSNEVAPDGVTANTIQPGSHDTERIRSMYGDSSKPGAGIPVGHLGSPADFGAIIAFLCSQQAGFITGASLVVDGGASAGLQ
jgi:3-oxoacyl-[acyl-carrier protein] reductase